MGMIRRTRICPTQALLGIGGVVWDKDKVVRTATVDTNDETLIASTIIAP